MIDELHDPAVTAEVVAHEVGVCRGIPGVRLPGRLVVGQARIVVTQSGEDVRLRVPEAVDGLLDVPDEEAVVRSGDRLEYGVLQGADVLVFIHRDHVVARGDLPRDVGRLSVLPQKEIVRRAGQLVEVKGAAAAALLKIAAVERRQRAGEPLRHLREVGEQPVPVLRQVGEQRGRRLGLRLAAERCLQRGFVGLEQVAERTVRDIIPARRCAFRDREPCRGRIKARLPRLFIVGRVDELPEHRDHPAGDVREVRAELCLPRQDVFLKFPEQQPGGGSHRRADALGEEPPERRLKDGHLRLPPVAVGVGEKRRDPLFVGGQLVVQLQQLLPEGALTVEAGDGVRQSGERRGGQPGDSAGIAALDGLLHEVRTDALRLRRVRYAEALGHDVRAVPAQELMAEGVDGRDVRDGEEPQLPGQRRVVAPLAQPLGECPPDARAHLERGRFGKGDGEQTGERRRLFRIRQGGDDARRQDGGLTGAGGGRQKHRAVATFDRRLLRGRVVHLSFLSRCGGRVRSPPTRSCLFLFTA